MERISKECPRCKGERGWWDCFGRWNPCITCRTKGTVLVSSEAEFRRLERSVTHPEKVQTKQREKGD